MKYVQHTVRLPLALDKALRHAAQTRQATTYALLQQCVKAGIVSLSEQAAFQTTSEMAQEIGIISTRLAHVERLTERALFVACAAYVFARAAAGPHANETTLTAEINAAFIRQLNLAGDM